MRRGIATGSALIVAAATSAWAQTTTPAPAPTPPGYANGLPMVLRRYCGLWGRGT